MTTKNGGGYPAVLRLFSLAIVTALFGVMFTAPMPATAQSNPGDFLLYGVNLSGTAPWVNDKGQTLTSGVLATTDSRLILNIPAGTFIRNAANQVQPFVSATLVATPPSPPSQHLLITVYELGTPGATFSPTVGLTFYYPDTDLPTGVAESSLYIAQWNGAEWIKLVGTSDIAGNRVSTTIANFTTYALIANLQPPTTTTPATTPATTTTLPPTTQGSTQSPSPTTPIGDDNGLPAWIFLVGGGVILLFVFLATRKG